jgi:hypothetical protein
VFLGDPRIANRVNLPVEVLSGRAYTAIRKSHPATVPQRDTVTRVLTKPYGRYYWEAIYRWSDLV